MQQTEPWIDVHAHLLDGEEVDPSAALRHMAETGVSMMLLSDPLVVAPHAVRASNERYARAIDRNPQDFGLLAALPTGDPEAAVREIAHATRVLGADGFVLPARTPLGFLGAPKFRPVWDALDEAGAGVLIHPSPLIEPQVLLPAAVFEVAFDTTRTAVDMMWQGLPTAIPHARVILAHAGGALPMLAGRILMLSEEDWVPHDGVDADSIAENLSRFFYDTAISGTAQALGPVLGVAETSQIVYGSDFGAPCASSDVLVRNIQAIRDSAIALADDLAGIRRNAAKVFPRAAARARTPTPA